MTWHNCFVLFINLLKCINLIYSFNHYSSKVWNQDKEINTFIQQGVIKLIKSDSKDIYIVVWYKKKYHGFCTNINQHNSFKHW